VYKMTRDWRSPQTGGVPASASVRPANPARAIANSGRPRVLAFTRTLVLMRWAFMIALLAVGTHATAGVFMFMPSVALARQDPTAPVPTLERQQFIADLFYSTDLDSFRFLTEVQIDSTGSDVERLQVGWRISPDLSFWFGRYHNPIGYWNVEHHHGHFMETSAERPQIIEFEDEGGPLPIHLVGGLLTGMHPIGQGSLSFDFGVAAGPRVIDGEFEAINVINDPRFTALALVARASYRPDATSDDQYGVSLARTKIPIQGLQYQAMQQDLAALYVNRDFDPARVFGEVFRVSQRLLEGPGPAWPSYWAGYVQGEYKVVPGVWTAFARYEAISSRLTEDYINQFPKLSKQREIVGARWDFYENQALKLEYVRDVSPTGFKTNGIELQWSAMFHF
jgi:hypothetical protein